MMDNVDMSQTLHGVAMFTKIYFNNVAIVVWTILDHFGPGMMKPMKPFDIIGASFLRG